MLTVQLNTFIPIPLRQTISWSEFKRRTRLFNNFSHVRRSIALSYLYSQCINTWWPLCQTYLFLVQMIYIRVMDFYINIFYEQTTKWNTPTSFYVILCKYVTEKEMMYYTSTHLNFDVKQLCFVVYIQLYICNWKCETWIRKTNKKSKKKQNKTKQLPMQMIKHLVIHTYLSPSAYHSADGT